MQDNCLLLCQICRDWQDLWRNGSGKCFGADTRVVQLFQE